MNRREKFYDHLLVRLTAHLHVYSDITGYTPPHSTI